MGRTDLAIGGLITSEDRLTNVTGQKLENCAQRKTDGEEKTISAIHASSSSASSTLYGLWLRKKINVQFKVIYSTSAKVKSVW